MQISKLIYAVLTYLNRRFVEGGQSTIDQIGIAKTPVKNHNVYITKQYGKTEENTQSSKKESGRIHGVLKVPAQSPLVYKFGSKYPS